MRIEEFDDNSLRIVYDDDGKILKLIDRQGNTVLQPVGWKTNPLTGRIKKLTAGDRNPIADLGATCGRNVVLFGDSITNQNVITPGGGFGTAYGAHGYFVQANIEMGWAFNIVNDAGVSSDTTAMMLARIKADVLDQPAQWVVVLGGTNDIPSGVITLDEITTNLKSIYDQILANGQMVIAMTILPNSVQTATPRQLHRRRKINEWIKTYATTQPGIFVVDSERSILDVTTNGELSGMTNDGVHPSANGARFIGRSIVDALSNVMHKYPSGTSCDNGYAINPCMAGSNSSGSGGFIAGAGITGVGPNGLYAGVRNTGAGVGSKVTRSNDWRQEPMFRLAATFTANFDSVFVESGGSPLSKKGRYDQAWAASTAYQQCDRKRPTTINGFHYVAMTAGTTGASEPTWPVVEGEMVVDGGVTWRCQKTPAHGDVFVASVEFDASSLVGGAQPMLEIRAGYTDGTFMDYPSCGYIDLSAVYGTPPLHIPATGRLVTPPLTLDLSVKTLRYLYARFTCFGKASSSVNIDITRLNLEKL